MIKRRQCNCRHCIRSERCVLCEASRFCTNVPYHRDFRWRTCRNFLVAYGQLAAESLKMSRFSLLFENFQVNAAQYCRRGAHRRPKNWNFDAVYEYTIFASRTSISQNTNVKDPFFLDTSLGILISAFTETYDRLRFHKRSGLRIVPLVLVRLTASANRYIHDDLEGLSSFERVVITEFCLGA